MELKAAGKITDIILQPHMELIPKFEKNGVKYRNMVYTPDFLVYYPDGSHVYIEVKGFSTIDAGLRRKLFNYKYPDDLQWVTGTVVRKHKFTVWRDYDEVQKERRERKKAKKKLKEAENEEGRT